MRRIRVLQVIPKLSTGGGERIVLDLLQHLNSEKFEVAALSLYPDSGEPFEDKAAELGLKVFYLDKKSNIDLAIFSQVKQVIQKFQPDIVHNHLYLLYTILPVCKQSHIPIIHTIHNTAEKEVQERWRRFIHKIAFSGLGVIPVSISKKVLVSVHDLYGRIDSPIIFNGLDTKEFVPSADRRNHWRSKNNIDASAPVFVNVARFHPQKNHSLLVASFKEVVRHHTNAMLLLVGDGSLLSEVKKQVVQMGLQKNVRFLGVRSDVVDILNAGDIFVLSSDWEGLPVSVLEAMSVGKPVIATSVAGVPELISNQKTGILVEPKNKQQLTSAMMFLGNNLDMAKAMGVRARQVAIEKYNIRQMARQYEDLYVATLERRMAHES